MVGEFISLDKMRWNEIVFENEFEISYVFWRKKVDGYLYLPEAEDIGSSCLIKAIYTVPAQSNYVKIRPLNAITHLSNALIGLSNEFTSCRKIKKDLFAVEKLKEWLVCQ